MHFVGFPAGASRISTRSCPRIDSRAQQLDRFLTMKIVTEKKRLILQSMDFVLTGFSCQKEKEIEGLIRKYGGTVLSQIPPVNSKGKRSAKFKPQTLPIVLCLKKVSGLSVTYGCSSANVYMSKVLLSLVFRSVHFLCRLAIIYGEKRIRRKH